MPPRLSLQCPSKAFSGLTISSNATSLRASQQSSLFSSTACTAAAEKRRQRSPYAIKQAALKKVANQARQTLIRKARREAIGDPVASTDTPFITSLQNVYDDTVGSKDNIHFSHYLTPLEVGAAVEKAGFFTRPDPTAIDRNTLDPQSPESDPKELVREHNEKHKNAVEAIRRILSLSNGSGADKTRLNIQSCIDKLGRHATDGFLSPKPGTLLHPEPAPRKERAGKDTGSPEVQIAVLTTKIRALDQHVNRQGATDKHNKRSLRLLVHKRQKMLKYLRRQDRGGSRFQYVMETLGLSDAAWKGEISLPR